MEDVQASWAKGQPRSEIARLRWHRVDRASASAGLCLPEDCHRQACRLGEACLLAFAPASAGMELSAKKKTGAVVGVAAPGELVEAEAGCDGVAGSAGGSVDLGLSCCYAAGPEDPRLVQASRHRRRWFLLGLRLEGACRLPGAFSHPLGCFVCIFSLQRAGHGEQSLRNPGEHGFINRFAPKRHGHGSSLVGAGIVVFSVDENRDRNEMGLAIRRQFKQSQSARTFGRLRRVRSLRKQLWWERAL